MFNMFKWWEHYQTRKFAIRYKQHREFLNKVKDTFTNQLLAREQVLINAYAKQSHILAASNRAVIAVFIREDVYKDILLRCITPKNSVQDIIDTMKNTQEPIGFFGDVPIYLSDLMTQSPIFVVGEITWTLQN